LKGVVIIKKNVVAIGKEISVSKKNNGLQREARSLKLLKSQLASRKPER